MFAGRSLRLVILGLIAGLASAAAAFGFTDSPTLVVGHQIGDMRLGESEAAVGYEYGGDCLSGCAGLEDGSLPGIRIYRYRLHGGYIRVGYRSKHVVYLETNSSYYRSATGLRVGTAIPFGARWHQFRWHNCAGGDGYWITATGTSATRPTKRWWTQLSMNHGRVIDVSVWRGDTPTQEC